MAQSVRSRWIDSEEDSLAEVQRKREKEERKRLRALKASLRTNNGLDETQDAFHQPAKRRKILREPVIPADSDSKAKGVSESQFMPKQWTPCRHISNFERLNHIEEGSYGWVSRARERATGEVVALKKLKVEGSGTNGFPVTGFREIQCLLEARHRHIVDLREIVVGDGLNE